jgi:hypothetical protein
MGNMQGLIKDIFYAGLGLYIVVYFLVQAVTTAVGNATLAPFAPLITLVIVISVMAIVWIIFGNALGGKK